MRQAEVFQEVLERITKSWVPATKEPDADAEARLFLNEVIRVCGTCY